MGVKVRLIFSPYNLAVAGFSRGPRGARPWHKSRGADILFYPGRDSWGLPEMRSKRLMLRGLSCP